jgi:hypothetical protein
MKLTLYHPIKPFFVNQGFGVNGEYYRSHGINIIGHNGLDLRAAHGQEVYAAHDGICYPEVDGTGGEGVVLISDKQYEVGEKVCNIKTIYWHLTKSDAVVKTGQHVKAGDVIGYADSTGLSSGDHLHFGLKPVSPGEPPFSWVTLNPENGYLGAINPTPYLVGEYPKLFLFDMQMGDINEDVRALQKKLQTLGYFPAGHDLTNFYGGVTREAVFAFQKDRIPNLSFLARYLYRGRYCSTQTRAALNRL